MNTKSTQRIVKATILIGSLTALVTSIGCSKKKSELVTVVKQPQPITLSVRPEAPKMVAFTASNPSPQLKMVADKSTDKAKSKDVVFKSRDYGVEFQYPWQYTRVGAKAIAADYSLQPQSDGLASQISLVRIDVPKGFYADTDFDNGYFIVSLNPELKEPQCEASLNWGREDKPQMLKINGVDFQWTEFESGGHGEAAKVRNYVTYVNNTCYEIETGVKTKNDGKTREVNPDQVLKRLEPILMSVKIDTPKESPAKQMEQGK
jgi:hypothetical protein